MPLELEIAGKFFPAEEITSVQPLGAGLINDSYLVSATSHRRTVLQRINRRVFPDPERIMENLRALTEHIRGRQTRDDGGKSTLRIPEVQKTRDGRDFVVDSAGGFWRALEYIANSVTLGRLEHHHQAEAVGAALGRFHALIHDLDPARLHQTLPGFHHAPGYFRAFLRALARTQRTAESPGLRDAVAFAQRRRESTRVLENARVQRKLVVRPIHGDTKLNNFLFDPDTGSVTGLVDLDTVQPGLIHYDLGDCLRSCANPDGESPDNLDRVHFDLDIARVILEQYLIESREFVTHQDIDFFYDAIRLIPYALGLRFLTDHLVGDRYFKIDHPGHNLHRALTQFRLTASIEAQEPMLRKIISQAFTR